MKTYRLIVLAGFAALTTACVVYDPAMYPYHSRRVVVQGEAVPSNPQAPAPNAQPYTYEYIEPAPPAVVVDPFFWLFSPWYDYGYYGRPYGYYHGHYYGGYYGGHYGYRGHSGSHGHRR